MTTQARAEALNGAICQVFDISGPLFAAGMAAGVILSRALVGRDRETFEGIATHFAELSNLVGADDRYVQEFASRLIRLWDLAG